MRADSMPRRSIQAAKPSRISLLKEASDFFGEHHIYTNFVKNHNPFITQGNIDKIAKAVEADIKLRKEAAEEYEEFAKKWVADLDQVFHDGGL